MRHSLWWVAFACFAAALSGLWTLGVYRDRASTLLQAQAQAITNARVLEQYVDRALESAEGVVDAVTELVQPWDLRDQAIGRRMFEELQHILVGMPQITAAWVMNSQGETVLESWSYPPRTTQPSPDRDYFKAHIQPTRGNFVGAMEVGGITGKPRFTISQRLTGDDGSFRGVVVAGIYSSYFADVYREASLDPGARFSLSTTGGRLLASWPESSENSREHDVIKAERTLARLPVIVSVVLPKGEVLAGWRNRAIASGAGVLVVIAACGALTRLGHRSFARESAALDRIAAINRDLESKVAERTAALASSENELRALYDTAPVGMCMFDLDLRFLRVNKRLAEINGIDARDHIGRTVYEVVPALASQAREIANKVIETGEPVLNVDFEGETPAAPGARRSWNESWVPLKGQDGRIVGINVVAEETTAKKRAEKKIMALLAETQRLSQYNELAAREMSHRVMNSFQLLESLLVLQERRLEDTVAKQALDLASTRVRAMSVVQRRLFHATRGDVTTVDLGDYLRDLCEELARAFAGDRCTVSVDAEHGIVVSANEGSAVAMIATELVINACKYAFSDGDWGRISVRLAREQADGYRLEVNDNGRGLPADFALGGSKGVGTRIVNSMASQLKAKLEIDRTGPGARFIISVPGYIAGLMKPKEGMQASTVAVAGKHHDSG